MHTSACNESPAVDPEEDWWKGTGGGIKGHIDIEVQAVFLLIWS
jgi:hypothetical protein